LFLAIVFAEEVFLATVFAASVGYYLQTVERFGLYIVRFLKHFSWKGPTGHCKGPTSQQKWWLIRMWMAIPIPAFPQLRTTTRTFAQWNLSPAHLQHSNFHIVYMPH